RRRAWSSAAARHCRRLATQPERSSARQNLERRSRLSSIKSSFPGGNLHSSRREAWIYDLPSAFSARHRQPFGIKQSDLHKDAGLIPINMLVRNLAVLEADKDG